ncbi:HIT family protein [Nocardia sp. NBC_01388]|uniref:HIT family protein n=1 Tax=Nocardia sp. NBC_01388 TaxID=2903596 RepID=UPI003247BCD5
MTFPHGYDDDCAFCTAFRFGPTHPNSVYLDDATARHANWTIFEDPNVVVLPTIGPVAPGHTMVLAREHYLSFAHVSPDLARYAESVAITLSGKLSAEFGDVIWFEHGPMSEKATGGSCTSHAHLHCVPVGDVDISGQINERLTGRRIESFADLAQQAEREQPYLYYRTQGGEHWVYDVTVDLPCQFLRRVTATALGNGDWDWLACPHPDVVHQTITAVHW